MATSADPTPAGRVLGRVQEAGASLADALAEADSFAIAEGLGRWLTRLFVLALFTTYVMSNEAALRTAGLWDFVDATFDLALLTFRVGAVILIAISLAEVRAMWKDGDRQSETVVTDGGLEVVDGD